ncbi:uncharacterized protein LOC142231331 [Haematobia irritans]|uniref:uncharacterized protein LOC142231331 n=1 Tax=Haematobia irritans TaxID=7368 RepID=UPI003F4F47E8
MMMMRMRLAILFMALAMAAIAICEEQQQIQENHLHCQQQQHAEQEEEIEAIELHQKETQHLLQQQPQQPQHQRHHNLSIMQNFTDLELPGLFQRMIAACCSVVRDYYGLRSNGFMFSTNVEEQRYHHELQDFITNLLMCVHAIKVEVEYIHGNRFATFYRKFNLIVVDSAEALRNLNPGYLTREYDIQEHHLLYLMDASRFADLFLELHQIFTHFWQYYILNVAVVVKDMETGGVIAYTYFPFHDSLSCRHIHIEIINSFYDNWSKPIDPFLYPEKVKNLHQCPLTAAVWNTPPYLSYKRNDQGVYEIDYWEAVLLGVLSAKFNFSVILREPINNQQRGKILEDGTITGAMRLLHERIADLSLGSFRYTLERNALLTATLSYYQTWQVYAFLKGARPYTSLEILVYAFDDKTWICLMVSLLVVMITATILQFQYEKSNLARIIMGIPKPMMPLTNIIRLFTGQPIVVMPDNTFCRFVLILWDLFGLLMRTAYQSLLFQLLQSNLHHPPPLNLEELMTQDCKIVTTNGTYDSVSTVPTFYLGLIEVIKIKNVSEQSIFFFMEEHRDECFAGISPQDFIIHHTKVEKKRGIFLVLPEKIFTQHITMYFSKHSFLIDPFNDVLMNLRAVGLIDFWARNSLDTSYLAGSDGREFMPLTMNNLEGVFFTYIALTLFSLFLFCVEIVVFKLRK